MQRTSKRVRDALAEFSDDVIRQYCETTFNWMDLQALKCIELENDIRKMAQSLKSIGSKIEAEPDHKKCLALADKYQMWTKKIDEKESVLCEERAKLTKMTQMTWTEVKDLYLREPA